MPTDIKIETTNKELSSFAGLKIFADLKEKVLPSTFFTDKTIPALKSGIGRSFDKFGQLLLGFVGGAECLEDMDRFNKDPIFKALNGERLYGSKSHGDFLRSFSGEHCLNLNKLMSKVSYSLRCEVYKEQSGPVVFDIDSTPNEQSGIKMEGVCHNYKGLKCLDTVQVFDDKGYEYWHEVRPGNTHTAKNSPAIIHGVFSSLPSDGIEKILRGDSGYCNFAFFSACQIKEVRFVVCMRKLMLKPALSSVKTWNKQDQKDKSRILFKGGRECEFGETTYSPKGSGHTYRLIVLRSLKEDSAGKLVTTSDDYDYQGWISSLGNNWDGVEIIKLYRKRGHCENFIRELKNGFDLKHYPCQKLNANRAYGIIAAFAYNLVRFVATKDNLEKPQFSKAIRLCYITIPCQIVRHARYVTLKLCHFYAKEVSKWLIEIQKLKVGLTVKLI